LNYRNYWSHQKGDATERSAIHYLLSSYHDDAKPFHHPEFEVNRSLSQCITAVLNHGADPNAVDSNGVISILELALPICPRTLVELMLEKGALVTPKLLLESGAPLDGTDGIPNESRWRRPECYTPEARFIARGFVVIEHFVAVECFIAVERFVAIERFVVVERFVAVERFIAVDSSRC
jgi:hypothetical protein